MTDGLKSCEKLQNRKTKLGTSALNVHNEQTMAERGEEVFYWAPQAAVTHGLSVNYTWVTAVTNSNVTDGLKTCEILQNRKTKRGTSALRVHNAQNRDKRGEEVFCLAPKAAVTHGLSVNYTWVTAVIDRLQSEAVGVG